MLSWKDRALYARVSDCLLSVEGTDCKISPNSYSQKYNGLGFRYELGVSVESNRILLPMGSFIELRTVS